MVTDVSQSTRAGETFFDTLADGHQGPALVWIPEGSFLMGDIQGTGWDNEQPVHKVRVEEFALGVYPVTFAEYDRFVEAAGAQRPHDQGWGRGRRPVINVSWLEAIAYCEWMCEQTGEHYRLPTEAEWEYAARAGKGTNYWWGNLIEENRANCRDSGCRFSNDKTSPVDFFGPNSLGVCDMIGNVWEWTCSKYEEKYAGEEQHFLTKDRETTWRAIRGGSWRDFANRATVSSRAGSRPDYRTFARGFRVVSRTVPPLSLYPGFMP